MEKIVSLSKDFVNNNFPLSTFCKFPPKGIECFSNKHFDNEFFSIPRNYLEDSNEFKQLVVGIVIENENGKILTFKRNKKGIEDRLHNKKSITFGGHINGDDLKASRILIPKSTQDSFIIFEKLILKGFVREFEEELLKENIKLHVDKLGTGDNFSFNFKFYDNKKKWEYIKSTSPIISKCIGFINNEDSNVNSVHFGVVFRVKFMFRFTEEYFRIEDKCSDVNFVHPSDCLKELDMYEDWSRFILTSDKK